VFLASGKIAVENKRQPTERPHPTGLVYDELYALHEVPASHPESPRRLDAVLAGLDEPALAARLVRVPARDATEDELIDVHLPRYVRTVRDEVAAGQHSLSTGDTDIGPHSYAAALRAAGGVCAAVDAVAAGAVANAFCAVRPPGHHASAGRGMGFCVFNNVAVAARRAQKAHGLARVLIVDWDVHHGNGTQDIFYEDPSVLYFSTHLWPWYPGTGLADQTGSGPGKGTTINVPLAPGDGRDDVLGAMTDLLVPAADAFRPDIVLISAGFDSRCGDPLGRLLLYDDDFADMTRLVIGIADRHAGGRVVSTLEGGYLLEGLKSAAAAHVRALAGL